VVPFRLPHVDELKVVVVRGDVVDVEVGDGRRLGHRSYKASETVALMLDAVQRASEQLKSCAPTSVHSQKPGKQDTVTISRPSGACSRARC
jgi:hypothetical protein